MPKVGMKPIRRRQLIDATLDAINEVGMHDATIAQIARRAGVSTGIISRYFRDKNGLLEATLLFRLEQVSSKRLLSNLVSEFSRERKRRKGLTDWRR